MSKSRPLWLMTTPLVGVLLLAIGWSAFWYIALENAKQRFHDARETNLAAGRNIECGGEQWGGYPFQLRLDCTQFRFTTQTDTGSAELSSGALSVVALAYKPQHLIAEMHGPVSLTNANGDTLSFATGEIPVRASLLWNLQRAEQVSILAESFTGDLILKSGDTAAFTAERMNVHMRFGEPDDAGKATVDVVARLDGATGEAPLLPEFGVETLEMSTVQLDGTATDVPVSGNLTLSERARQWQEGGGRFEVRLFRVDSNVLDTQSSGELVLDDQGRIEGDLSTAVRGFDEFLIRLSEAGMITDQQARGAEAVLIVLGKASGDPENPAIEIQTDVKMGRIYFGPFKILHLPALF